MQKNVAIIVSRFNSEITEPLLEGAQRVAKKNNNICTEVFRVPGAVEIPLIAQKLAQSNKYSSIVTLGAVIRGETSHYDYVCEQVSTGCQHVALKTGIPVIFGILTTENEEQAHDRIGGKHGHKGEDCMEAAIQMMELLDVIK